MNIASANLSPKIINVSVIGQVKNPGNLKIASNTPLVQAILNAGGPIAWKANRGNVELIRVQRNGKVLKKRFKIDLNQNVSFKKNPPLKNQDIVYVRSSKLNNLTTGLGAIVDPFAPVITGVSLYKLLN